MSTFFAIIFGIIFWVIHCVYTITPGKHTSKVAKTVTGHDRPLVDTVKAWWIQYRKHFFLTSEPCLHYTVMRSFHHHNTQYPPKITHFYTLLHTYTEFLHYMCVRELCIHIHAQELCITFMTQSLCVTFL